MKKSILSLAIATLALGFTACEDVPAPYTVNAGGDGSGSTPTSGTLLEETFSSSLGSFAAINVVGNYSWAVSYSCAQVTSYVDTDGDGTKENNPAESWLVSPKLDLSQVENANVSFEYILRYANASELKSNYQLLVSSDYTNSPASATWTALDFNPTQGSDWDTWYNTGKVGIPAEFIGQPEVTVALCYKANAKSATWEVKNFKVETGEGDAPGSGDTPGGEETGVKELPYAEAFSTTLGGFKNYTTSGSGEWVIDYSTAKATGYDNASQVTTAGTYYLVSPEISLANQTEAHVAYEYILRYDKGQENQQLYITTAFDETKPAEGWTLLNGTHTEGKDWSTFSKADIAIPAEYMGKTIRLAFRYNTNAESGSTWEVKNFSIAAGKAGDNPGGEGDKPGTGDDAGDPSQANGDFENWTGGKPNNWTTASTAGNATLSQSTDAHGGKYAVEVGGTNSANKRIAYKEMTLPAGTYTMKFYTKAASATGGSVRPGYVPIKDDGSVGSYVYGDYVNDLTQGEWVLVTHEFTLAGETKLCLVIMNSKNPGGNVLIDDFTLTDGTGKVYIK